MVCVMFMDVVAPVGNSSCRSPRHSRGLRVAHAASRRDVRCQLVGTANEFGSGHMIDGSRERLRWNLRGT